jgi:hypothetical protein
LAGIKLLVDCAYEDNTLPITWTNCVIKVKKNKKNDQNDENNNQWHVCFRFRYIKSPVAKPLTKSASRWVSSSPRQFLS